ncbi:hypothetical protein LguiA_011058 [Lonicera macranthoides]
MCGYDAAIDISFLGLGLRRAGRVNGSAIRHGGLVLVQCGLCSGYMVLKSVAASSGLCSTGSSIRACLSLFELSFNEHPSSKFSGSFGGVCFGI